VWSGLFVKAFPKVELVVAWNDYRLLCMVRYGALLCMAELLVI
jgi:hypothetical protein